MGLFIKLTVFFVGMIDILSTIPYICPQLKHVTFEKILCYSHEFMNKFMCRLIVKQTSSKSSLGTLTFLLRQGCMCHYGKIFTQGWQQNIDIRIAIKSQPNLIKSRLFLYSQLCGDSLSQAYSKCVVIHGRFNMEYLSLFLLFLRRPFWLLCV